MDKILEKIDNYNLFTNIIPGYLLLLFNLYYFEFDNLNIGEQVAISYFIGQTLNRIASIMVKKLLFKFTKEKGESYEKYILASQNDSKIGVLMQEKNMYRNFCAMFIVCIFEILLYKILKNVSISSDVIIILILLALLGIYAISFCKHNKYIADRIRICNNKIKKTKVKK